MGDQLYPEDLASVIADLGRRLSALETAPRVGLHQIRAAWATAAVDPTVFGAWETGAAGSTWIDDAGTTGAGYPYLEVVCSKVLIVWSARPISVANAAGYRSAAVDITVAIDGTPVTSGRGPIARVGNSNAAPVDVAMTSTGRRVLDAGLHTFQIVASWVDSVPAAGTSPRLTDSRLTVIPLSAA